MNKNSLIWFDLVKSSTLIRISALGKFDLSFRSVDKKITFNHKIFRLIDRKQWFCSKDTYRWSSIDVVIFSESLPGPLYSVTEEGCTNGVQFWSDHKRILARPTANDFPGPPTIIDVGGLLDSYKMVYRMNKCNFAMLTMIRFWTQLF